MTEDEIDEQIDMPIRKAEELRRKAKKSLKEAILKLDQMVMAKKAG